MRDWADIWGFKAALDRGTWRSAAMAMVVGLAVMVNAPALAQQNADDSVMPDADLEAEFEDFDAEFGGPQTFAEDDVNDPFEGMNRFFFKVNNTLDRFLLKPVARAYRWTVPQALRNAASNIINNLGEPVTFANDLFQGEFERALNTGMRFSVNSTFGFLGAADLAQEMGMPRHTEDFGQTLGVYGVPEGPYLFLPALGPAPPRDLVGRVVDTAIDPTFWLNGHIASDGQGVRWQYVGVTAGAVGILDARARNIEALDEIERTSIDFYATVRSLYRQSRNGAIRNGRIDLDDLPELEEFE